MGGFFAIYGHKKSEEEKKVKTEENEVSPNTTAKEELTQNNEDYFCEDYPIYL